jgi:hypothetical protein
MYLVAGILMTECDLAFLRSRYSIVCWPATSQSPTNVVANISRLTEFRSFEEFLDEVENMTERHLRVRAIARRGKYESLPESRGVPREQFLC